MASLNLAQQWQAVKDAPLLYVAALLTVTLLVWWFVNFIYKARIERLEQDVKSEQGETSRLRNRIGELEHLPSHLASPAQAKESRTEAVKPVSEKPSPELPFRPILKSDRVFLGQRVTPQFLADLRKGKTDLQSQRALAPYQGKWMKFTGAVSDVSEISSTVTMLSFRSAEERGHELSPLEQMATNVVAFFDHHREALEILHQGDVATIQGKLEKADDFGIKLEECELITSED